MENEINNFRKIIDELMNKIYNASIFCIDDEDIDDTILINSKNNEKTIYNNENDLYPEVLNNYKKLIDLELKNIKINYKTSNNSDTVSKLIDDNYMTIVKDIIKTKDSISIELAKKRELEYHAMHDSETYQKLNDCYVHLTQLYMSIDAKYTILMKEYRDCDKEQVVNIINGILDNVNKKSR